jgi:phosphopantetheinyl transferase
VIDAIDALVCFDSARGLDELVERERILAEMVRRRPQGEAHLWRFRLMHRSLGRQAGRDGPDTNTLAPILLRHILGIYLRTPVAAVRMERTAHGKPFIAAPTPNPYDLRFNMSHSSNSIAIVLAEGHECGVDVEERPDDVGFDVDQMVRFCGTPQEVEAFSRLDPGKGVQAHFLRFWTLKEAITKAIGVGLSYPLRQLDFYRPSLFSSPVVNQVLNIADRRFACCSKLLSTEAVAVAVIADEQMRTVASPVIYIDPYERSITIEGDEYDS